MKRMIGMVSGLCLLLSVPASAQHGEWPVAVAVEPERRALTACIDRTMRAMRRSGADALAITETAKEALRA
jgi:hypothetical protein